MFVQYNAMGPQGSMKRPRKARPMGQADLSQSAPGRLINWGKGLFGATPAPAEGDQFSGRDYYADDEA